MNVEGEGQGATPKREARAERHFDSFNLALRGGAIEGHVDAMQLPRVSDLLAPDITFADVRYRIIGLPDSSPPALEVWVQGAVPLVCQRCLEPFVQPVDRRTVVLLARDERELARLDEEDSEHEVILADVPLDPVSLVEDELVLTLPFVARCPEATCPAPKCDRDPASHDTESRVSPFDALRELRTKPASKRRG